MKLKVLFILISFLSHKGFGQDVPGQMQQLLAANKQLSGVSSLQFAGVTAFYAAMDYKPAWIEKKERCLALVTILKKANDQGLNATTYQVDYIDSLCNDYVPVLAKDSALTDLRITLVAIQYFGDLVYGNTIPVLGYNGLSYTPHSYNIPSLLAEYVSKNDLSSLNDLLSSSALPEIAILETRIRFFNQLIADTAFYETVIKSSDVSADNDPLVLKLYQLGCIHSINDTLTDKQVKSALKEAQRQFGLLADGVLRSTIMEELNRPISTRLQALKLSINYYRWLHCLVRDQPAIVVNIPAAYMKVYLGNKVLLEMRMVLGKPSTPTPLLLSKITEVIFYPYWHVPFSIATRELLPRIRKDPAYLEAGNYQVLNLQGKIIDPFSVNWQAISAKHFPYIIRQSTGCDNALGLLKLNFFSPFGVYLHDTPFKDDFTLNKRYFSHGCLRLENPMELGHLIMKNHPEAIDTLEEKGCLRNQSPVVVPADEKMPVLVWYNPAGIDSTGRLLYYEDIYKKFNWQK